MSQSNPVLRMSLIATSVALSLISVGCGGAADTTAALTEAAVAGTDATTLTLDETSRRRRESERQRKTASTTSSSGTTVPTTTTTTASAPTGSTTTIPTTTTSTPTPTASSTATLTTPTTTVATATNAGSTYSGSNPIQGKLINTGNIEYLGGFALPVSGDVGVSRFGFGGYGLSAYKDPATGKLTLFVGGFDPGRFAQVEVPSGFVKSAIWENLPVAKLLQKFTDITNGEIDKAGNSLGNNSNGVLTLGTLAYNGRLITTAVQWYAYDQLNSHGVASINFKNNNTFQGFYSISSTTAPIRALSGEMGLVPSEWQTEFGSPAVTGNQSVSIRSTTSYGPSLTTFDPDQLGRSSIVTGKTLLFYPSSSPLCGAPGCDQLDNPIFNGTSRIRGFALVKNSSSVLYIGTHGVGGYWYGTTDGGPNGLKDLPQNMWTGDHSSKYEYRIWAYNANELAAVKRGEKNPWDVKPYAIFDLPDLSTLDPLGQIKGSTYDQDSGLLFITTMYFEKPRVEVYRITP